MHKYVVVVESPAKAKTINKYLGKDYYVLASYGHVRDLENKTGAVDPDHDFAMNYVPISRNSKHVDAIAKALREADGLLLATDPDREGEAISWHLQELLKQKRSLTQKKTVQRVVFHEITKTAIQAAINQPRDIAMDLVNAQQARRALDYLVGFTLSPLLWKKIRRGLSAGRVQSPALRLIVEREEEIERFVSQEYWSLVADVAKHQHPFSAKLVALDGKKLTQFDVNNAEDAAKIKQKLLKAANGKLTVSDVEKKQRKRNPAPPFTTSTLQQEAARKLGFSTKKTMMVAQQLYEGIDVGEGATGLITYMRTDSVNLAQEALQHIRAYIVEHFTEENLPHEPRYFKTKSKNAQEAHEAIRPTDIRRAPEQLKAFLTPDQFKLYQLIWKRTVACQMIHATIDTVAVILDCGTTGQFKATGSIITKPGYMRVYQESFDQPNKDDEDSDKLLPELAVGETVDLRHIATNQHFTEPPPRYSEASLVKTLEEFGIGRPSTYSTIISTLQQREYAILEQKRFKPTDVGRIVNRFLTQYFTQYVDYGFTANLEDQLDEIARGEKAWVPVLESFWQPFHHKIEDIAHSVKRADVTQELMEEDCPKCQHKLAIRLGKAGRFIGCTNYPDCDYTRNLEQTTEEAAQEEIISDHRCPLCEGELLVKTGKYGKFIGCRNYPTCRHMEPLQRPAATGVACPQCQEGEIVEKRSRKGKTFYACNRYPTCQYALWNPPVAKACPKCQWPIVTHKSTKRSGEQYVCPQEGCGHVETISTEES